MLYNDFAESSPIQIGMFLLGCMITFIGVYFITTGSDKYGKQVHLTGRESVVIMAGAFVPVSYVDSSHDNQRRKYTRKRSVSNLSVPPRSLRKNSIVRVTGALSD